MKSFGRRIAVLGFIACLQAMTSACGSRGAPVGPPVTAPPEQPPAPESPVSAIPEPPREDPVVPPTISGAAPCALIAEPGEPVATVALSEPVRPANAPRPSNGSERLLFRQLYETLVTIDCNGDVRPGLASSWQLDAGGRAWNVTLRENASFADGAPVRAADVRASWTRGGAPPDELNPHVSRLVESAAVVSERELLITLRSPRVDVPAALSHPDLAIAKAAADSPWPLGTRAARIVAGFSPAVAGKIDVLTVERDGQESLRFLVATRDPRDLLDEGVDLLLTRDPAALDYAATLPHFQSLPLAWGRTQVLLMPGRERSAPLLSEPQRQGLADDAVRGEARGAQGPFWWQGAEGCALEIRPPVQRTMTPRIVYDADDGAARDLAERLVGLARTPGPAAAAFLDSLLPDRPRRTFQRAAGLSGNALVSARQRGSDAGYVMSVPARTIDACADVRSLVERVPWIDVETIVPLVDTRLRAIVRHGRSGVITEWDGGLVVGADGSR